MNFVRPFVVSIITIVSIFLSMRLLKYMSFLDKFNADFYNILKLTFYALIPILPILFPLILFIVVVLVYNKFIETRELIILKNIGLTKLQLLRPIIYLSIIITIFSYFLTLFLIPKIYYKISKTKTRIQNNMSVSMIKENNFFTFGTFTIYASKKENESFDNIIIYNVDDNNSLLQAKKAIVLNNNIKFINGTLQEFSKNNKEQKILFFDEYTLSMNEFLNFDKKAKTEYTRYSMPTQQIYDIIKKQKYGKNWAEFLGRCLYPLMSLLIPILSGILIVDSGFNRISNLKNLIKIFTISISIFVLMYFSLSHLESGVLYFYLYAISVFTLGGGIVYLIRE